VNNEKLFDLYISPYYTIYITILAILNIVSAKCTTKYIWERILKNEKVQADSIYYEQTTKEK
jgi:hypothetical protein